MISHVFFRFLIGCLFFLTVGNTVYAQVQISEPSKELGDIFENGGLVKTRFELTNPNPKDSIHILNVETSCGCTVVLTQDTIIKPNGTLELEVSYDPSDRLGLFVKSIAVETRTGKSDFSTLYLKISGNVISETPTLTNPNTQLLEYKVVPIFFFPITPFDTSYLDFSYITTFVNDLTYEIDFYQFTTVGFEIGVRDKRDVEALEHLLNYSRTKLLREFQIRGFSTATVFFDQPVFKIQEVPVWASAQIKVYSVNFNTEFEEESVIRISGSDFVESLDFALNQQQFNLPTYTELLSNVNFEMLEGKLFRNSKLELQGMILTPSHVNEKQRSKIRKKLSSLIFKELKKRTGITKKNVFINFDSLGVHPENKYRFLLWDKDDEQDKQKLRFEVKQDKIVPPLLPTYRQSMLTRTSIDTANAEFRHFWSNLILNQKAGHAISLIIESSVSHIPRNGVDDNLLMARNRANAIGDSLADWFAKETNGGVLTIVVKPLVRGPEYTSELKKRADYAQFEYVNLIPTTHADGPLRELHPHPYQVNFDYYFNGVDTATWLFDKFANYLAAAIEQDGFVELRIESSISRVPVEHDLPNEYLIYSRANESERRLRLYMRKKLIDDNRIIISEQRYLVQGPEYDGTIPILQYRKFQYIKIIPQKYLTQE